MLKYDSTLHIILSDSSRQVILEHCSQALEAFSNGEKDKGKAFGLTFGTVKDNAITIEKCFPLQRNVRSQAPYKDYMDKVMSEHAIPSVTPLDQRGWVADPSELFSRIKECRPDGQVLLGTYHMHRVGWEHDRKRDTPTILDAVLVKDSGLVMFIISMVDPAGPILRAFFEGNTDQELPIH